MLTAVVNLAEGDELEMAILSGQVHFVAHFNHFFGAQAISNQVFDGDDGHIEFFSHFHQLGQSRHRAVGINDLDECCGRVETGDTHQVNRGLGVASTLEHALVHGAQGIDVARSAEVLWLAVGIGKGTDGHGTVVH